MRDEGKGMRDEERESIQALGTSSLIPHPSSLPELQLSGELPLGQALIKLAATPDEAAVSVDGETYLAKSLRARILADLEMAGHSGVRSQESGVRNQGSGIEGDEGLEVRIQKPRLTPDP